MLILGGSKNCMTGCAGTDHRRLLSSYDFIAGKQSPRHLVYTGQVIYVDTSSKVSHDDVDESPAYSHLAARRPA
jgi:hypothetical protein